MLFCGAVVMLSAQAHAQSGDSAEQRVKIRLVAEKSSIRPNETIWIGIEEVIDENWHTYWINPGDSGEPTRTEWDLPDGFSVSDIQWPAPHKIAMGPFVNYGYEDKVVLLQSLTAPAEIPEGPLELSVDIELLVCEEICIPEYGTYTLTLNNGTEADNTAYIDAAMQTLPFDVPLWDVSYGEQDDLLTIKITPNSAVFMDSIDQDQPIEFFPYEWGIADNTAPTNVTIGEKSIKITQKRGDRSLDAIEKLHGLLAYTDVTGQYSAIEFEADANLTLAGDRNADKAAADAAQIARDAGGSTDSLLIALLFALFGGIILNLMPCVFPILSIKALSLCRMQGAELNKARMHGIFYTAGILATFAVIAGGLMVLKAGGAQIGWGFQLQNPSVVLGLAWLLFLIGLNLSGYFSFSVMLSDNPKASEDTATGSFLTGVLATLVATPCTAPFMGVALGFAIVQPPVIGMLVFLVLGFGLALPYLLLSFFPALRALLPKPGAWMEYFKQFLAFPMFLSAIWLTWVFTTQAGNMGIITALGGMVMIVFGLWLVKISPHEKGMKKLLTDILAFAVLVGILFMFMADMKSRQAIAALEKSGAHIAKTEQTEPFTTERYDELIASGEAVFVNMTADWCITCKVNESVALDIPATKILMRKNNIRYLKGDWTNQNPEITNYLDKYGRNGVPIYVYYAPVDPETGQRPKPKVLPQILTPGMLREILK